MTYRKTTQETAMMDCHAYPETAGKPAELAKAKKKKKKNPLPLAL